MADKFYTSYVVDDVVYNKIMKTTIFRFSKTPAHPHITWHFGHSLEDKIPGSKYVIIIPIEKLRIDFNVKSQGFRVVIVDFFKVYNKQNVGNKQLHLTTSFAKSAVDTNKIWANEQDVNVSIWYIIKNILKGNFFIGKKSTFKC